MKRGRRKKLINWLVYLGAIVFWSGFWLMIFFVPPTNNWMVAGLLGNLLLALGLTFFSFSENLVWSSTAAFYFTGLFFLKFIGQLHWLNVALFSAVCLAVIYRKNREETP